MINKDSFSGRTKQSLAKYLPREPRKIDEDNWFYLDSKGIILIHRGETHTDQILISWGKIIKAIEDLGLARIRQAANYHKPKPKNKTNQ